MNTKKIVIPMLITFFLVFLDQASKYFIRTNGGFYICNTGVAWGILIPKNILLVLTILAIFVLFYLLLNKTTLKNSWVVNFSIILILSGALSNLFDRLYFGCVIDFIQLPFWPIFNLADICITVGAVLIILNSFQKKQTN